MHSVLKSYHTVLFKAKQQYYQKELIKNTGSDFECFSLPFTSTKNHNIIQQKNQFLQVQCTQKSSIEDHENVILRAQTLHWTLLLRKDLQQAISEQTLAYDQNPLGNFLRTQMSVLETTVFVLKVRLSKSDSPKVVATLEYISFCSQFVSKYTHGILISSYN